jgi:regulator of telomere elongation helicase 1
LIELEKRINDATLAEDIGFTKPGPYIYDFLADIKINHDTVNMLVDTIDHAMNLLEDGTICDPEFPLYCD